MVTSILKEKNELNWNLKSLTKEYQKSQEDLVRVRNFLKSEEERLSNKIIGLKNEIDSLEDNLYKSKSENSTLNATIHKQNNIIINLQGD